MKVSQSTLLEIRKALRAYQREVDQSNLAENTKVTYDQPQVFV